MHIAVCVATFRRPKLLQKLLNGIADLRFVKTAIPEVTVIVVDNDASETARMVCSSATLPWRLKYVVEPKRGIAEARNCALKEIGDADFVAFIDDDEVPANEWLDELLSTQAKFGADVVAGPIRPSFTGDVPEWVRISGFFGSPARLTGEPLAFCSTNNTLVMRPVFDHIGCFDDRFQLTGGEDVQFFTRVRLAGFKIVWSAEAIVSETMSGDRTTLGALLRRAYNGGNCYSRVESSLDDRIFVRLVRFFKGFARILQGLLNAGASLLAGRAAVVRALLVTCGGVGMIAGLAGLRYESYKTVSGDRVD